MTLKAAVQIKRRYEADMYRAGSQKIWSPQMNRLYRAAIQTIRQYRKPVSNPKMTLEQAVQSRLSEFAEIHETGVTEMTGKLRRTHTSQWDEGEVVGRHGGMKSAFPELEKIPDSPKAIAAAIRRGSGKVYRRIVHVVRDEMERAGFQPGRKRSPGPGRPVVPAHEGREYCSACKVPHSKNQHRFHGSGSFHKTHLWSFPKANPGKPVVIYDRVFAITARKGQPHPTVCDAECKAKNHCYIHEFKPGAVMYGLPNGDILIRSDKK